MTLLEKIGRGFRVNWGEPHHYKGDKGNSGTPTIAAWREEGEPVPDTICFPLRGANVGTLEYIKREYGPMAHFVKTGQYAVSVPVSAMRPPNRAERRANERKERRGGS